MTSRVALVAAAVAFAAGSSDVVYAGDSITLKTAQALETWVDAVRMHVPGHPDAAVAAIARLTYENRVDLNAGLDVFFAALETRKVAIPRGNKAAELVVSIGQGARMPDAKGFYERAAILHTDAVVFEDRFPQPDDPTLPAPPSGRSEPAGIHHDMTLRSADVHVPPLLTNTPFVMHKDGEVIGTGSANWNWVFARSLLDRIINGFAEGAVGSCRGAECTGTAHAAMTSSDDPFIGEWYHATTAYMLAKGLYGDATDHLHRAGEVLPADAMTLFDRASYAEILGLPLHQVLLADWRPGTMHPRVPALDKTNSEAEHLYRRALEVDAAFVEARVRLGRLLGARGAHAEASKELKAALASNPKPIVAFYAHLFAARAEQTLGNSPDAAAHYRSALALYPDAQSALLGASQLALLSADVPATVAPIERLGPRSAPFDADPWRAYQLASGRDVNELMHHMWEMSR